MSEDSRSQRIRYRRFFIFRSLLLILLFCAAAFFVIVFLNGRKTSTYALDQPYDLHIQNGAEDISEFSQQTAVGFAADLVAAEEEVPQELTLAQDTCKMLLFNLETKDPVYAHRIYQKIYPASLAKIMTAILAIENAGMNATVTMTEADFDLEEGAQTSSLMVGDTVTMDELFHLLVIYSSNDAAMAIARTIAGSTEQFVDMMNNRAREMGMTGTHFTNPTGLHEEGMYTTAYDVYLMLRQAYSYQDYLNVSQMAEYTTDVIGSNGATRTIYHTSTDQYLTNDQTLPSGIRILASKTGTTDQAGSCLALVIQNEYGVAYTAIVMGALNKPNLYSNMTTLLNLANT